MRKKTMILAIQLHLRTKMKRKMKMEMEKKKMMMMMTTRTTLMIPNLHLMKSRRRSARPMMSPLSLQRRLRKRPQLEWKIRDPKTSSLAT